MSDALRAEWTKLRTIAGTWWLMAGGRRADRRGQRRDRRLHARVARRPGGAGQDPTKLALIGVDLGQAVVAVLAILAVTEEYGTGMIRVTLAATPRRASDARRQSPQRRRPRADRGAAGRRRLPDRRASAAARGRPGPRPWLRARLDRPRADAARGVRQRPVPRPDRPARASASRTVVRDTAVSTGVVLGLLYLPPLLAQLVSGPWRRHLQQIAPMTAGLAIQATRNIRSLPISPWAGLGVLAAWAAGTLVVA